MHFIPLIHRRRSPASWRLCAVMTLIACAAGCEPPGKPNPADRPVMPDQVLDFHVLYAENCAGCHGAHGKLGPAPPLNDPLFTEIVSTEDLIGVIRDGRPGTPMPAFLLANGGALTEAQVNVLAEGIKSQWKSSAPLDATPPNYLAETDVESRPSAESVERGAALFERACAGCHGANGVGGPRVGSVGGAINVPAFLALISDQALRRVIITGRRDLGMPNYAERTGRPADYEPLTSTEIDDVVALLAHWRAAGNGEQIEQP